MEIHTQNDRLYIEAEPSCWSDFRDTSILIYQMIDGNSSQEP